MSILVKSISKSFGASKILDNISFEMQKGELVALLGPSGSGKTTLLRIIAGLEFSDNSDGEIFFENKAVTHLNAYQRKAGFVFQHYALFPHMNVFKNVAFGLEAIPRKQRASKTEIKEKVFSLLRSVQIENLSHHYPHQLSGGQKQRVALARALAVNPSVLLMDEPFGALDAKVRKELRKWVHQFHDQMHITTLFVTHDQEEAFELADRVIIFSNGIIEQIGTPHEVQNTPTTPFVKDFLGIGEGI
jgi:sulfate transport system ATP-binding protein